MRTIRVLWMLLPMTALVWAQTDEKIVSKVIPVQYANANHVRELLVNIPGVSVRADGEMHVIVASGRSDLVAAVEEMVKKLDVRPRDIELTVYLVSGSAQTVGDNLPPELASTAKQLHAIFALKGYKLLESFVVRGREGRVAQTNGMLTGINSSYVFGYSGASVSGDNPRMVRVDGLSFDVAMPPSNPASVDKNGNPRMNHVGIRTDVDAAEGQKVVVGKSNVSGTGDAMILVLTAKVIE